MDTDKKEKIAVTGNQGYIGSVLTEELLKSGYEVLGIDSGIFSDSVMGHRVKPTYQLTKDIRDIEKHHLLGVKAVIHLAGLSNDPLGELDPRLTLNINYKASVRLAEVAKAVGVERFLFSSSCSMYGASGGVLVDESGELEPMTVYAKSKVKVERDVKRMVGDKFTAVFLRNATVFGYSPRLRLDLVVNNLSASGYLTGFIEVLSDGTPWRPNLHVRDCASAFIFLMKEPAEKVSGKAYNIGIDRNNMQVKDIANRVGAVIKGSKVEIRGVGSPDERTYKVSFASVASLGWKGEYLVRDGIEEVIGAFNEWGLTKEEYLGGRYNTLHRYKEMIERGEMDSELRVIEKERARV